MLGFLFSFISGLAFREWFSSQFFYVIFLSSSVILSILFYFKYSVKFYLILMIIFCLGFFYPIFYDHFGNTWELPAELIKKNVVVKGYIASIPKQETRFSQFEFLTEQFQNKALKIRLKLSWFNTAPVLLAGSECELTVKLKPPHGLKNPGSFDYEKFLRSNGIKATGYVVNNANPHCNNQWVWNYFLLRLRQHIQQSISAAIPLKEMPGLIAALTVGSRTEMSSSQWKTLQNTGTSHLMAISGLHVAFIAGLIYGLVFFCWKQFSFLLKRFPAHKAAAMLSMLAAIFYGLLAGFSLPTQRAVLMIVIVIAFDFFNRSTEVPQRLLWAAFLILLFQPLAISQVSFWLSFAAVAWICFGVMGFQREKKWRQSLRIQWVCFLGLLPITLLYFQQISLVMFLANALAIPWVGFIIVPLCFLASTCLLVNVWLGQKLFWLCAYLFWPIWKILVFLGNLPFAVWHQVILNPWIFISSMLAVIIWLAPRGWPARHLAWIFALPLFFYYPQRPGAGEVWLMVLDVGQGLGTVIQTQHHTMVYDAGPKSYGGFDAGEAVLLPYLRSLRISQLDKMIISHSDNDHRGGAFAILSSLRVQQLMSSNPAKMAPFPAENCEEGQSWNWDGVHFEILNPPPEQTYEGNDSSCVLHIQAENQAILLPGDIEKTAEKRLVEKYGEKLRSQVLVAPHHGSKTSSSRRFLEQVQAEEVIAATGFYNQFRFPSKEVLARYEAFHAKLHDTAKEGAIDVRERAGKFHIR